MCNPYEILLVWEIAFLRQQPSFLWKYENDVLFTDEFFKPIGCWYENKTLLCPKFSKLKFFWKIGPEIGPKVLLKKLYFLTVKNLIYYYDLYGLHFLDPQW